MAYDSGYGSGFGPPQSMPLNTCRRKGTLHNTFLSPTTSPSHLTDQHTTTRPSTTGRPVARGLVRAHKAGRTKKPQTQPGLATTAAQGPK